MTTFTWIHDGKKVRDPALARVVTSAREVKLERMAQIREELLAEGKQYANDRELMNQVRMRWRKEEQERRQLEADLRRVGAAVRKAAREAERKPMYVFAGPLKGRENSKRDNTAFDTLIGMPARSVTKPDGLSSFHCKFTSRGLGERRDRWRPYNIGEAVKHLRYIIRESARELSQGGVVSNVSVDPDELAGFFAALEHLERQDRGNAHVYTSLVISLPHELSPEGRERLLKAICGEFAPLELPYVGVLHAPDPGRDQRNFHTHIMFSLRPFENLGGGNHAFSPHKYSDLNDETFILPFRHRVAALMNDAMALEGHGRRFTALSDADRGLAPRSKRSGKRTIGESERKRKRDQLAVIQAELFQRWRLNQIIERLAKLTTPFLDASGRNYLAEAHASRGRVLGAMEELRDRILATHARVDRDLSRVAAAIEHAVARAQPAQDPSAGGKAEPDPSKAAAVAEAAAAIMRMPYPRQRKVGGMFQLMPPFTNALQAADWFEAEPEVQQAHEAKWRLLTEELEAAMDTAPRSPFVRTKGASRLTREFLKTGLYAWCAEAASDDDIIRLLQRWEREWKKREQRKKAADAAVERERQRQQAHREHAAQELVKRLASGVLRAAPASDRDDIERAIKTIARAAVEGRLIVQVGSTEKAYLFDREEDRSAARLLAKLAGGEPLLGKLAGLVAPAEYTSKKFVVLKMPAEPANKKGQAATGPDRQVGRDGVDR